MTGNHASLKPKDMCLIPFRVALAAQADGWWIRSVVIWNKLNPMPESVKDRPTESHEYVILLAKSERYFYDADAVREPYRNRRRGNLTSLATRRTRRELSRSLPAIRRVASGRKGPQSAWGKPALGLAVLHRRLSRRALCGLPAGVAPALHPGRITAEGLCRLRRALAAADPTGDRQHRLSERAGRKLRLPRVVRRAGRSATSPAPSARSRVPCRQRRLAADLHLSWPAGESWPPATSAAAPGRRWNIRRLARTPPSITSHPTRRTTRTWCDCRRNLWTNRARSAPARESEADRWPAEILERWPTGPAIVLDPFAGSGTTLKVAEELGRWWIGIDICEEYLAQIRERTAQRSLAGAFENATH